MNRYEITGIIYIHIIGMNEKERERERERREILAEKIQAVTEHNDTSKEDLG